MAHADQEALAAAPEMRQLSVAPEWPGATHSSTDSPGRAAAWSVPQSGSQPEAPPLWPYIQPIKHQ